MKISISGGIYTNVKINKIIYLDRKQMLREHEILKAEKLFQAKPNHLECSELIVSYHIISFRIIDSNEMPICIRLIKTV